MPVFEALANGKPTYMIFSERSKIGLGYLGFKLKKMIPPKKK